MEELDEVKYLVLKSCAESLLSKLESYENEVVIKEKLTYDVHYEMNNLIAFYKTEFKKYYDN